MVSCILDGRIVTRDDRRNPPEDGEHQRRKRHGPMPYSPIWHMAFSPWILSIFGWIPTITCFTMLSNELYNHTKLILANSSSAFTEIKLATKYSKIRKKDSTSTDNVMSINGEKISNPTTFNMHKFEASIKI